MSGRVRAILRLRCPRCLRGEVFRGRVRMHSRCSGCGLVFEKEAGYFVGAMYFAYLLAVALGAAVFVAAVFLGVPVPWALAWTGILLALSSPRIFCVSRVLWLHFDHRFGG